MVFLNDVGLKLNVGWNIKKVFVVNKSVFVVVIMFVFCLRAFFTCRSYLSKGMWRAYFRIG